MDCHASSCRLKHRAFVKAKPFLDLSATFPTDHSMSGHHDWTKHITHPRKGRVSCQNCKGYRERANADIQRALANVCPGVEYFQFVQFKSFPVLISVGIHQHE